MAKMKKKVALIFGITGQDGSYLAELLLKKNYIIHGVKRRSSSANTERIDHIFDAVNLNNKCAIAVINTNVVTSPYVLIVDCILHDVNDREYG